MCNQETLIPEIVTGLVDDVKSRYTQAETLDRDDAEVIPYDTLWDLVMNILERNQASGRRRR